MTFQDNLLPTYTIIYTIAIVIPLIISIYKDFKKENMHIDFVMILMGTIFAFAIGLTIHFYLILFYAFLLIICKNEFLINIIVNIPIAILIYKIIKNTK